MASEETKDNSSGDFGTYIVLDGKRRRLLHHPTDFSVKAPPLDVGSRIPEAFNATVQQLAMGMTRVISIEDQTDDLMFELRQDNNKVTHHIYRLDDTCEEIIITDHIFLTLQEESAEEIKKIVTEHQLDRAAQMDNVYTLKVTAGSGRNPLKIANELAQREGVISCFPEMLFPIHFTNAPIHAVPSLLKHEWHLTTDSVDDKPLALTASMNVTGAWDIAEGRGKREIVIAVIDDGFELFDHDENRPGHEAFDGSIIDEVHMKNFGTGNPHNVSPQGSFDFHGTPVASLIFGNGGAMAGVAPGCTFLPIRIGSISNIEPLNLIKVLEEVSQFADVVNCSFGMRPESFSRIDEKKAPNFLRRLQTLLESGGRRGKGLIIVFSAGNDNAPIYRAAADNSKGITFVENLGTNKPPVTIKDLPVHCGYAEIPGVVVVGAMTSIKRKADYSNWGNEITVVAPSDNSNELSMVRLNETPENHRKRLPELGIVAAMVTNGSDIGLIPRLTDDPLTPDNSENFYTKMFGGTSAAAALVSGVIGLMLSVNQNLTRADVIEILKDKAEHDNDKLNLEKLVDLDGDLNVKDVDGRFNADKRSLFFGSGRVDAAAAVAAAKAKLNG